MKHFLPLLLFILNFIPQGHTQSSGLDRFKAYAKKHKDAAIAQMNEFGIPASITLAQAILESNAGKSKVANSCKNHFGIKCHLTDCQKGHCKNFHDDDKLDYFIVFSSVSDSYKEHSIILFKRRYAKLRTLPPTDYVAWANALQETGYSTDKNYASKLISLIERLELSEFDQP